MAVCLRLLRVAGSKVLCAQSEQTTEAALQRPTPDKLGETLPGSEFPLRCHRTSKDGTCLASSQEAFSEFLDQYGK